MSAPAYKRGVTASSEQEQVARAICRALGHSPDAPTGVWTREWERYVGAANAAIAVVERSRE